ncbi:MAG: GSCFA domain-containing protein [Pikeienuella sp.]
MAERSPARRRSAGPPSTGTSGLDRWSHGPNNARGRIARGVVIPQGSPGFVLTPEARVFVIGSGFARQLEAALRLHGLRILSADPTHALREARENPTRGHLNKYNPASIQQEFDWASGAVEFPREVLMALGDAYADPCLHERAAHGGISALMTRREAIAGYFAAAFKADLTIVILDQIETWFDRRTKLALTTPPLKRLFDAEPDRFSFRRLLFNEVAAHLKAICARLKREAPKQKIVLAVSPVPIERTYTGQDVIVANLSSKSVLHAAAVECAGSMEGVDYAPIYETVTTSEPGKVWMPDRRTVRDEIVLAFTRAFVEAYGLYLSADSETAGRA